MTLVNMDSLQFWQPPSTAGLRRDERPTVSHLHVSTACGKDKELVAPGRSRKASESLPAYEIKLHDMIGLPPKESSGPLHMPAPNLRTEKAAQGTVSYRLQFDGR